MEMGLQEIVQGLVCMLGTQRGLCNSAASNQQPSPLAKALLGLQQGINTNHFHVQLKSANLRKGQHQSTLCGGYIYDITSSEREQENRGMQGLEDGPVVKNKCRPPRRPELGSQHPRAAHSHL